MKNLALLVLLTIPLLAQAAQTQTTSRSAGKLISDNRISLAEKLALSPVIRQQADSQQRRQRRTAEHSIATRFTIYDAWVELSGDDDLDGYYRRIKTSFDADVNTALETVYAKLYLSYQGGPWMPFADTELFEIRYDSITDSYEVETELLEGYHSGNYDIRIELYSFYHSTMVASAILYQDKDGYLISLEDSQRDRTTSNEVIMTTTELAGASSGYLIMEESYASGSLSWPGLLLLAALAALKWRYFRVA